MCGIAGVVGLSPDKLPSQIADRFLKSLKHRGPDGGTSFIDADSVVLVHTRLAIIDLSTASDQPMSTEDGRYTITFNGEIYNYESLRKDLESRGFTFRTKGDTEVLLKLYVSLGKRCVDHLEGMFAFAIWDRVEKSLFAARDALGIKPLYYAHVGQQFVFASEIRSLIASDLIAPDLDCNALHGYFRFGSVQEPETLIKSIRMLPAGHSLALRENDVKVHQYWYPAYSSSAEYSFEEAILETRRTLLECVSRHLVSDVPVGIFLSGGIDSTSLLSLARATGKTDLKTFCISFEEDSVDEGTAARRIAQHYGSDHYEWKLSATECLQFAEEYFDAVDQPTCDGLNTWCVSRLARQNGLKVVLSGLGGDELFGSYPSFVKIPKLLKLHRLVRKLGARNQKRLGRLLSCAVRPFERVGRSSFAGRLERLSEFIQTDGGYQAAYRAMRGFFSREEARKLTLEYCNSKDWSGAELEPDSDLPSVSHDKDVVSYLETTLYMRNQLLRDSDAMSMSHGLELRVPFVDRKLLDAVNKIPSNIRHLSGKRLLIEAVGDIPEWVQISRKQGFSFPFDEWIKTSWQPLFSDFQTKADVSLGSWFRKWSVMSLERFLDRNNVRYGTRQI